MISNKGMGALMFYNLQSQTEKDNYKTMLAIIGKLTRLFSDSDCPYLPYRVQENVFCKYFNADNLARCDCSADAKKNRIGVGLKTWMGQDDQKVAEFDSLRETYSGLVGIDLVRKIAEYRNERIRITKNLHGIDEMIYHIVKRTPHTMQILEHAFDMINLDNISVINGRGNANNTYFTDGNHTYHFSLSKNTLYMLFNDMELLDTFGVDILDDPYAFLMQLNQVAPQAIQEIVVQPITVDITNKICLRLYSTRNGNKVVFDKSGLNQWNADGRVRNANEIYIPFPAEDRERNVGFFPSRDQPFDLTLPDGTIISAKVCQADGKAIMSNPNKVLGEWLLRKVFELAEGTIVTYQMLEIFGIDSVVFTKIDDSHYSVDFAEIGTYERFYNIEDND